MCCTVSCTFPAKSPRWSVSVPRSAVAPQSLQQPPLLMQMMKRLRRQFPLFSSSTCWLPCFPGPRRAARIFHHKRRSLRNFRRNCCQRYFFRDRCRIHLGFPLSARYTDTGQSCYRKADPYPCDHSDHAGTRFCPHEKAGSEGKKSSLKRFSRCLFSTLCWLPSSQQSQPLSVFPHPYFLLSKH